MQGARPRSGQAAQGLVGAGCQQLLLLFSNQHFPPNFFTFCYTFYFSQFLAALVLVGAGCQQLLLLLFSNQHFPLRQLCQGVGLSLAQGLAGSAANKCLPNFLLS